MSKKMKVLVSVLVAILVLTVGGTAIALAQEEEEPAPPVETNGLLARVAKNLGVTDEELANAFKQARQEMRQGAFIGRLDKALENERITEDDYDEIKGWWDERPEGIDRLSPRCFINKSLPDCHMWGGHRGWHGMRPPKLAD